MYKQFWFIYDEVVIGCGMMWWKLGFLGGWDNIWAMNERCLKALKLENNFLWL
jgi:hypothetical protein